MSVRTLGALLTALVLGLFLGGWFMVWGGSWIRGKSREYTPETHRVKDNTPTMGGVIVITSVFLAGLLWADLTHTEVWVFLSCLVGFGIIGLWDDWCKIRSRKGISASTKFYTQCTAAFLVVWWWVHSGGSTQIYIPFFKNIHPDVGVLFYPWAVYIIVGTSNAVNLTDGLDGLAIGSLLPNFCTFSIIAYIAGNAVFADYLAIAHVPTAEIAVLGGALIGASLAFLWYNAYPAQVFMGDVGSLALGSVLALMALMSKQELLLPIAGGLFVLETVSVMVQVFSFKYFGRRIFKMAPIHHHFELLGWSEAQITTRFAIISAVLCLLALITLKIR